MLGLGSDFQPETCTVTTGELVNMQVWIQQVCISRKLLGDLGLLVRGPHFEERGSRIFAISNHLLMDIWFVSMSWYYFSILYFV